MITERLNALKSQGNYSWQDLSDMTGIPVPTIRKTFSGETVNPSFEVVSKLIAAMGGGLDDLKEKKEIRTPERAKEYNLSLSEIKALYEDRTADLWSVINKTALEKRVLFITTMSLVAFIIYLFADGMNGGWGFFRY